MVRLRRRLHRLAAAVALAAALTAPMAGSGPATAQPVQSFFGHDDRVPLAPNGLPWRAIGKFFYDDGGHCSGALVSERVVLTAAHCLFGGGTSPYLAPPVSFEAGHQKGHAVASADVESFWYPSGYVGLDPESRLGDTGDGFDYAFVLLREPIGRQTGYLAVQRVTPEDVSRAADWRWRRLDQAGYSADRPDQLTGHRGCLADRFLPNHTLAHRCDIMSGDSGSPIFFRATDAEPGTESGADFRVVAVVSSIYLGRQSTNIAVDSRAFADDLDRFLARYDPSPSH